MSMISVREGALWGSGPSYLIVEGRLRYFSLFSRSRNGFRWRPGQLDICKGGVPVFCLKDKDWLRD